MKPGGKLEFCIGFVVEVFGLPIALALLLALMYLMARFPNI